MKALSQTLSAALNRATKTIAPPPKLSLSQWTETFARIPPGNARPGRIDLAFAEYQRGILDAISDPKVERVTWMASSQLGKTQILLCALGYFADLDPSTMLLVQPTADLAKDFRKERITPFFKAAPRLRGKLSNRSRDGSDTLTHVEFDGGNLTLAGANAPAGLASRPKRILICDEVDRFPASAGTEGDPVDLAVRRTATFWNRKVILVSSPGLAELSRVAVAFEEGDQRRFHVDCPHCQHTQTLTFENVKWGKDKDGNHLPAGAAYYCPDCGAAWSEAERRAAVRGGRWIASAPFAGHASFHLSALYSPFVTIAEIASDFVASKGSQERLKTFKNTILGEVFEEPGEAPEWQRLYERREQWLLGEIPSWAGILTAATDVQGDRAETFVWAWGRGKASALVHHEIIEGDPSSKRTWNRVEAILDRTWCTPDGRTLGITKMAVDSGHQTVAVYDFCRRPTVKHRVFCVKGSSDRASHVPVVGPTRIDKYPGGKRLRGGLELWLVSGPIFKTELYSWLGQERAPPEQTEPNAGYVHLPWDTTVEVVEQLVGECLVTTRKRNGTVERAWKKMRANEALDCWVYARAATWLLGLDRRKEPWWSNATGYTVTPEPSNDDDAPPTPAVKTAPEPAKAQPTAPVKPEPVKRTPPMKQRQRGRGNMGGFGGW